VQQDTNLCGAAYRAWTDKYELFTSYKHDKKEYSNEWMKNPIDERCLSADPKESKSSTNGELLDFLSDKDVMKNVDFVNMMAYDSGSMEYASEEFKNAYENYKKAIAKTGIDVPVILGLSGQHQYPNIVESVNLLNSKANWVRDNEHDGIMYWTINDPMNVESKTDNGGKVTQVELLSQLGHSLTKAMCVRI
jgi:hypothetical protein